MDTRKNDLDFFENVYGHAVILGHLYFLDFKDSVLLNLLALRVLAWMQQKIHLLSKVADFGMTCQKNCVQIQILNRLK